jgi:predicted amidophosphoribosyltransferase
MYKCSCCESLIPFTYTNCPVCGNTLSFKSLHKVKKKIKEEEQEELSQDDSNLVVSSDIALEDL